MSLKVFANGEWRNALGITQVNTQAFRATISAALVSVPTTPVVLLPFDTEQFDLGNNYDNGVGQYKYVAPVSGHYVLDVLVYWTTDANAKADYIRVYKNGALYQVNQQYIVASQQHSHAIHDVIALNQGDYIQIYADTSNASNITTTTTNNHFAMYLIEAAGLVPATPAIIGSMYSNLVVKNNATSATSQVDVDADFLVLDNGIDLIRQASVNLTIDISASGANGLDTGTEASNTWYYIWVIYNPSTSALAGVFSTSFSNPTMPSGYTYKQFVGAVRNNASGDFCPFIQKGNEVWYTAYDAITLDSDFDIADAGDIDVSAGFPTASGKVGYVMVGAKQTGSTAQLQVKLNSAATGISCWFSPATTLGYWWAIGGSGPTFTPIEGNTVYMEVIALNNNIIYACAWRWNF